MLRLLWFLTVSVQGHEVPFQHPLTHIWNPLQSVQTKPLFFLSSIFFSLVWFFFYSQGSVSYCISGWPRTHSEKSKLASHSQPSSCLSLPSTGFSGVKWPIAGHFYSRKWVREMKADSGLRRFAESQGTNGWGRQESRPRSVWGNTSCPGNKDHR